MSVIVPDTSIVAKVFLREAESHEVVTLLRDASYVVAPGLLVIEIASAITRRFRMTELGRDEAQRALDEARVFFGGGGVALEPDAHLLPRAEEISLDLTHPLKDCLFLALAERENAQLITADTTLLKRAAPRFDFVRAL